MYSPAYNQLEDRAELVQFMRANSFVILVTGAGGSLHASHLPVQVNVDGEGLRLDMHMARANPQWKEFFDDEEVMVIFAGPHAYISPRWYEEQERVPTWNYAAVHAYGVPASSSTGAGASVRRADSSFPPPLRGTGTTSTG